MELDVMFGAEDLRRVGPRAQLAEAAGLGSIWFTEGARTAYLSCAAAGLATERIGVGTAVAVAFPRSPMVTASVAWELAQTTDGRFTLGLGTQVKGHVERRYSSTFAPPGPRLREYVLAVKAIFRAFRGDEALSFDGDHFSFSLLPPAWSPGPIAPPDPPVYVAAVGPWMTRMAGEVADGIHMHPFHSPAYVTEIQRARVAEGAARAGRSLDEITFVIPVLTVVGDTEDELRSTREHARMTIAFYGSTRSYAPVFELHGFEGLSARLHAAQAAGDLAAMAALVTDEVLDHYVVTAPWEELGAVLVDRYRDVAPSVRIVTYTAAHQLRSDAGALDRWADVAAAVREAS